MAETLTSSNPLSGAQGATATLTHDYAPSHDRGLPCSAGETLTVLRSEPEWVRVRNSRAQEGWVPQSFVQIT